MKELEIYVHIPFCVKKCEYCDFLSFPADVKAQRDYVDALLREIAAWAPQFGNRVITTCYIGGGTPTWLEKEQILRIMEALYANFAIDTQAEITMECNPGSITTGNMLDYYNAGINRLSIGLQSAIPEELEILGRIHTVDQFLRTFELARTVGFSNINVDVMSNLPYQTVDKMLTTLQTVVRLKPEHISFYSLMIEKGTPFYERYKFDAVLQEAGKQPEFLPTEDEAYRIYKTGQQFLEDMGYHQYEISNFARNGYVCRHNIGYWKRREYLGLGLGASSLIDEIRFTNTRDFYTYLQEAELMKPAEAVEIKRKAQMEEFMFLGLRMNEGVSFSEFADTFHVTMDAIYHDVLRELQEQELLMVRGGIVALTDKGMDLANYCMGKFLLPEKKSIQLI